MKRLAGLLAATGVVATAGACGSSHRAHVSSNDLHVGGTAYSGRLYSVREVSRAFAALGLELHRAPSPAPGLASLVNNARLGPQHIPSPQVVTVYVVTRRHAAAKTELERRPRTQVTRYANITAVSKPAVLYLVRGAVSALRWGTASTVHEPRRGLIVPGSSIDRIRLYESRADVEKAFGVGRSKERGLVSYFGGRLIVDYWFHDGLYKRVEYLETRWTGYRTASGVHVGSSRRALRPLYATCAKGNCVLLAGPWPDPVGTTFTIRHGTVVDITIGSLG